MTLYKKVKRNRWFEYVNIHKDFGSDFNNLISNKELGLLVISYIPSRMNSYSPRRDVIHVFSLKVAKGRTIIKVEGINITYFFTVVRFMF